VAPEIAHGFAVRVGDALPAIAFPDDLDLSARLDLRVVGVFRAVPPTDPAAELVVTAATIPAPCPGPRSTSPGSPPVATRRPSPGS
jgi:putative ABC transport system permease protein